MKNPTERIWLFWLGVFVLAVTSARIWLALSLELAPDEAYYWQWSNRLSFTYLDHPPLVAWLIRAGTLTAGQNPLGVRLHCIVLSAAAVAIIYRLGRDVGLGPRRAFFAACLSSMLPAPAAASLIATPDTSMGFLWMLALAALLRLSGDSKDRTMGGWYLLGASFGLGLLAKHTAWLIPLAVPISAIFSAKIRRDFSTPHPWLATASAGILALPYLAAEAKTGFRGFSYQFAHLSGALDAESTDAELVAVFARFAELAGGQLGLVTPLLAPWIVIALLRARNNPGLGILAIGLTVPLGATFASAFFAHPEQNWASLGHQIAAIIAIIGISSCEKRLSTGKLPANAWMSILFGGVFVITSTIHVHALEPFLPLPANRDPSSRLHGWKELRTMKEQFADIDAVVCDNYGLAAEIDWQLNDIIEIKAIKSIDRLFDPPQGRWLIVDGQGDVKQMETELHAKADCDKIHSRKTQTLKRADGQAVRSISVAIGENCRLRNR